MKLLHFHSDTSYSYWLVFILDELSFMSLQLVKINSRNPEKTSISDMLESAKFSEDNCGQFPVITRMLKFLVLNHDVKRVCEPKFIVSKLEL